MSKKPKILTDSAFLLGSEVLVKLKGIIFFPLIISKVGMESYGVFVQVLINPGIIAPLCSMSLNTGFLRFTSKFNSNQKEQIGKDFYTIIIFSFLLSLIGASVLFILSPIISDNILSGKSVNVIKISSIIIINEVLWRNLGFYLKSRKYFKPYSILVLLYQLLPYLGFVTGVVIYSQILHGVVFFVIIQFVFNVLVLISVVRYIKFELPSLQRLRLFISYSWALLFSNLSGGLLAKSDRYFIGYFLGPSAIGAYSILYQIISFIDHLSVPFRNYFGTYLPKMWDGGGTIKALSQIRIGMIMFLSVSVFLLGMIIIFLLPFLSFLSDYNFATINNYYLLIISISIGVVFLGLNRFYFQVIKLQKKNHLQLIVQLIALLVNVILNIWLLPIIGMLGAGIATLVGYLIILIINGMLFRVPFNIKTTSLQVLSVLLSLSVMLSLKPYLINDSVAFLVFNALLCTVVFFALLFSFFWLFKVNEIYNLKNVQS
jgi:O-antigen/teichoic acid export membrane protein